MERVDSIFLLLNYEKTTMGGQISSRPVQREGIITHCVGLCLLSCDFFAKYFFRLRAFVCTGTLSCIDCGHTKSRIFLIYFHVNLKIRPISYNSHIVRLSIWFLCTPTIKTMMFELKKMMLRWCLLDKWSNVGTYV